MWSTLPKFVHFYKTFHLGNGREVLWLISGGVLMCLLEFLGISAIFPLLMLIMQPSGIADNGLIHDLYVFFGAKDQSQLAMILGVLVAGVFIFKNVFQAFYWRYEFATLARWRVRIIQTLYRTYMNADYETLMQRNSGGMVNALTYMVPTAINSYIHPLLNLINYMLTGIVILGYIVHVNWVASLVLFVVALGLIKTYLMTVKAYTIRLGNQVVNMANAQQSLLQQSFVGYKDTKANLKENFFAERFFGMTRNLADGEERLYFLRGLPPAIVELMAMGLLIVLFESILITGQDIRTASAQIGVIVLSCVRMLPILNRSISAISSLNGTKMIVDDLHNEVAQLGITDDTQTDASVDVADLPPLPFDHALTLNAISYTYPGKETPALHDISMTIKPGEFIGMTGPSGGGKSTLTNILLGFLTRFAGTYEVDGTPISPSNIRGLRHILGYVDQNIFMMDATIAENVAFGVEGDNIDRDKVIESLKKAQLYDIVQNLPQGIDTNVGENGKLFSGGQRQRLAIARAFYRDIKILILDEASAALDVETEHKFFSFLETLKGQLTVIMIAHRLSTLKGCDRVYFLEGGKIKDFGTFEQLHQRNETFRSYINFSQIDV